MGEGLSSGVSAFAACVAIGYGLPAVTLSRAGEGGKGETRSAGVHDVGVSPSTLGAGQYLRQRLRPPRPVSGPRIIHCGRTYACFVSNL